MQRIVYVLLPPKFKKVVTEGITYLNTLHYNQGAAKAANAQSV